MKKIYLFRHGDKQKIKSDSFQKANFNLALAPSGIAQIKNLAKFLQTEEGISKSNSRLYSSPYPRTVQSAEIMRASLDLPEFHIFDEFEEIYFARDYTKTIEENIQIEDHYRENPDVVHADLGKSLNQITLNAKDKLIELAVNSDKQNMLISCHGGIIRNIVFSLDSSLQPAVKPESWADFVERGGFTELNLNGEELSVVRFNYIVKQS